MDDRLDKKLCRSREGGSPGIRHIVKSITFWIPAFAGMTMLQAPDVAIAAGAAWKPDRNVEIIANTSPGTGSDTTARLIHKLLLDKKLINVTATVVNKIGGGGTVGLTYLTQHAGNGHYLMVTSPTILTNHITGKSALNYTDTTPLAQLGSEPVVFSVRADSPLKSARDLAERLRTDPGALSIAIGNSAGSHNHIAAALVAKAVGASVKRLKVVAFNGSTEGIAALLGGHIDVVASPASGVLQHFLAGKVRILAVSSEKRLAGALAAIPTWKEAGIAVVVANWRSVAGPKGLSDEQIVYWDSVFARLAQSPDWKQELAAKLEEDTYLNSRATRKLMETQYAELAAILADLGLAK
jgi:putative tricarboxylic transport membrane protein